MSYSVSNEFKTQLGELVQEYRAYIEVEDGTFIYDYTDLQTIKIHNELQNNNKRIFGNAPVKYAEIQLIDPNGDTYDLLDKELKVYMGLTLPDTSVEFVLMGTFTVINQEKDTVNEKVKLTCYDDMILFNQEYTLDTITFPITLGDLAQQICDQVGVTLMTPTFPNSTYTIQGETTAYKPSYRELIIAIGELSITNAYIGRSGGLYIQEYSDTVEFTLTADDEYELNIENEYGPVNVVSLLNDPGDLVYRDQRYNMVSNYDFSNGTTGWSAAGNSIGIAIVNDDLESYPSGSGYFHGMRPSNISNTLGNKYFYFARMKNTGTNMNKTMIQVNYGSGNTYPYYENSTYDTWVEAYGSMVSDGSNTTQTVNFYGLCDTSEGSTGEVILDNEPGVFIIDMTANGLESLTDEEMLEFVRDRTDLRFLNNEYATNQETDQREDVIDYMYDLAAGFSFQGYNSKIRSPLYIDMLDAIDVYDFDGRYYQTYVMNQTITYNGAILEDLTAYAYTQDEDDYKYGSNVKDAYTTTTIKVDKANNEITIIAGATEEIVDYLDDLISDDCMESAEKNTVSRVWEGIKKEYDRLVEEATRTYVFEDVEYDVYTIDDQLIEYENSYETLRYIMEEVFFIDDRDTTTCGQEGDGDALRTALADYMGRKQDLSDALGGSSANTTIEHEAKITVNSENIELKVGYDDVVNSINISTEGIVIEAEKIDILGTANIPTLDGTNITLGKEQEDTGVLEVYSEYGSKPNVIIDKDGMIAYYYDEQEEEYARLVIDPRQFAAYSKDGAGDDVPVFNVTRDEVVSYNSVVKHDLTLAFKIRAIEVDSGSDQGIAWVVSTVSPTAYEDSDWDEI